LNGGERRRHDGQRSLDEVERSFLDGRIASLTR